MTGWFIWIEGTKGPEGQKWSDDTYQGDMTARKKEPRRRIFAAHALDAIRYELTVDELAKVYPCPASAA